MMGRKEWLGVLAVLAVATLAATAQADIILQQNFNAVSGTGGGTFLVGAGFNWQTNWDDGITGELSFGGTTGNARVGSMAAYGTTNGGVSGSGAGVIDVAGVNYNMVDEAFEIVSGTGGGTFLAGNGTANTSGYTPNWDDGIVGEQAYAGTFGGAAIQTGGGAAALGLTTGGVGGGGGGRIAINNVTVGAGHWYGGVMWSVGPFPGAAPFYNPSFEQGLEHWFHYGNTYSEPSSGLAPMTPHTGDRVLKLFGTFPGPSAAYQAVAAQPGQVWSASAFTGHRSSDAITGTQNHLDMVIEFRDSGGALIDSGTTTILSATSPTDTWIDTGSFQRTAPAGTVMAQVVFIFQNPASQGGAGLVDDVTFVYVGGPAGVDLSQHALTANVLGAANGAGSVLGDYQLRIEDAAGARLIFRGLANGAWQTIGGPLNTAIEADPNGTPATGVFNVNSPSYQVVLAFDDEYAHRWGTGGMLTFDNIQLTNADSAGSAWYAGLDWPGLVIANPDLSQLNLSASVLGSVPGGNYELRIEAQQTATSSLDQNFNTVSGLCPGNDCVLLDPNDVAAGTYFALSTDWDTVITGEQAYGGVYGGTDIWSPGGISARGRTTGGVGNTRCAEIRVENMILGPSGSGWYAGLQWGSQHLASTDLSQVTLRADIKGTIATGGTLGEYELRIEDAEGDRMYFAATATGAFQSIGGLLSTATLGPALTGGGDGIFDLDSPSYTVVIAFADEANTWQYGGVLTVDNLFLTAATQLRELGRITFPATANGSWQTVGGLLSAGTSTFTTMDEDFNTVTGVGGGEFWVSHGSATFGGQPWDTGIEGEETFAGTWGTGTIGTETAEGCTTCGVSGSGGGRVTVTGTGGGASGGWWAGLTWVVASPNWSDLSQVFCTADVKASKLAPFQLRIEDGSAPPANPVWLAFTHTPTTTGFEAVGGPMSQGVWGCPNPPCAAFNYAAPYYRVTLIYSGGTADTAWGTGGTLTLDNLFFTQIGFGDADTYTVTLTFDNEVATWGNHGRLTVDNLGLGTGPVVCHGDLDCDGTIGFGDINPFVLYLSNPAAWQATYPDCPSANGDINGDGSYPSFGDINPFVTMLSQQPPPTCP